MCNNSRTQLIHLRLGGVQDLFTCQYILLFFDKRKLVFLRRKFTEKDSNGTHLSNVPTRNTPLCHNCYLQAPDGDILCTCDKKKTQWYVSKQLGEVVKEDPFTVSVRLLFQLSGHALGAVESTTHRSNVISFCSGHEIINRMIFCCCVQNVMT
ncbi:hypothetical protein TSAR_016835 [Trichomalopsis sarcophagae]|uniref:Uncharacterized protein n=1 Tax=Trichomalopsis sarcophagae TaxID=543379 RepID=A0A232EI13_9HYME|nr:hypothetical protein TSAR_016835 [Trichomalopsis sarcophagae]